MKATDRFFKALSHLRKEGATMRDAAHVLALSEKVRLEGETAEEKAQAKEKFDNEVRRAFILASQISRARRIGYTDRYYVDPIQLYELLIAHDRADRATVLAAILHPVLRPETSAAQEPGYAKGILPYLDEIREAFGAEVQNLVCGALRIREINLLARIHPYQRPAQSDFAAQDDADRIKGFHTMIAEVVDDPRAAYLRIAMRLVILDHLPETLSLPELYFEINRNQTVYEPFADQNNARKELEKIRDFNLKHEQPAVFEAISKEIEQAREIFALAAGKDNVHTKAGREAVALKLIEEEIKKALPKDTIATIERRIKSPSSIYIARQKKGAHMDLSDIIGFRVIIAAGDEAEMVQHIYYHHLVKKLTPSPRRKVKNFIANPKPNGFQGIVQTFSFAHAGPKGDYEIQAVGKEMHRFNETTHSSYKGRPGALKERPRTRTVYIGGGDMHSVPVGASSADLLAQLAPEVAFKVNARSIRIQRANPFKPLPAGRLMAQPLETGDFVQFEIVPSLYDKRRNRREIIRACRTDGGRAILRRFDASHPPAP